MNIKLKSLKYTEQELAGVEGGTYAFTATLYIDGKRLGRVKNSGQDGATHEYPHPIVKERIEAYAETLPPHPLTLPDGSIELLNWNADCVINGLVSDELHHRKMVKLSKKATVFKLKNDDKIKGKYRTITIPYCTRAVDYIYSVYGGRDNVLFILDAKGKEVEELPHGIT